MLGTGCGDEAPSTTAPAAIGTDLAHQPGAAQVLAGLRARVQAGTGLTDASWGQEVAQLQRLLWPVLDSAESEAASRAHVQLTHLAGDIGQEQARSATGRAERQQRDPLGVELHDAWLVVAAGSATDYRAWCQGAAQALLGRLEAERAKLFDRPR